MPCLQQENIRQMCVWVGWFGCVGWQVLKVLEGHTGPVLAVAISTDGAKIVSGSEDKTMRVWSVETGEVQPVIQLSFTN